MSRLGHAKVSTKADGGDSSLVLPSDWNAAHTGTWVDAVTSSSSNTLTGQLDFRAEGSLGISLGSNTVTYGLNLPVASASGLAAGSNARVDVNPGSRMRLPVTDLPGTLEGDIWYGPAWDEVWFHDGGARRERHGDVRRVGRHRIVIPIERIAPPAVDGMGAYADPTPSLSAWGDANDDDLAIVLLLAA